ncbi:cell envelope-related function transcriptional attenuator common domain-containing protein [Sinosporangium album]|uniref:Cell envelope-related function transcriptional attenuator common domain-containing protein n=1 Tax=Sinosporangium album TaxID=504805 RepID=A0A1G7W1R9_9ACTN|nr:LCP family protein [Sinosporangium album]SDG65818.1 cell envelope-related function transcriptional attenuator common domain-containing protein [Sinosporangium album]
MRDSHGGGGSPASEGASGGAGSSRDGEEPLPESGVQVGGDGYGGVRLGGQQPQGMRALRKSARARRRNLILAGAMSSVVLAGSAVLWALPNYAASQIGSVDAGVAGSQSQGAMNILLVGVDKRDNLTRKQQNQLKLGRESGQRTDTMMVVHLSEDHSKVTVVSLPRDTWTTIPGKGEHKINAAYQLGGANLAVDTVEKATGLTINHYVEVNVLGFIEVVDSLGGVSVCTPVAINDPKTALDLAPGTYQLDGVKALAFARTRATARSDLDRIDRQQQFMSALLKQALSGDTLTNPAKLAGFIDSTLKTLTVDRELAGDLVGLADQLRSISTDDVSFATVPIADSDYRSPTGESAVLWDKPAARDLFRRINADEPLVPGATPSGSASPSASAGPSSGPTASPSPTPSPTALNVPPGRITLRVLNGTPISGLGARTRTALVQAGFLIPDKAGDTRRDHTQTIVRYGPGQLDAARTVAASLPGSELRDVDIDGIEVIIGRDQPAVEKVSVTGPPPSSTPSAAPATPTPTTTATARTATQNICKQ